MELTKRQFLSIIKKLNFTIEKTEFSDGFLYIYKSNNSKLTLKHFYQSSYTELIHGFEENFTEEVSAINKYYLYKLV